MRLPGMLRMSVCLYLFIAGSFSPVSGQDEADYMIRVECSYWSSCERSLFQYDDGTPHWLTEAGMYRGVWFDSEDFYGSPIAVDVEMVEYWFYHHPSVPWDTDQFYAELWTGTYYYTDDLLDRAESIALHYSPVYVEYEPSMNAGTSFWAMVNTSLTSNGTPSTLADEFPNWTGFPHSYFSNDFESWEVYIPGSTSITSASWGWIKGLFR
ncbi:MAG: hypothetical protein GF388_05320 [Candidatus Aegiribacteria sp.]|nr:hypothetical protein [Candidatus Aegiribacteria sp.]MBD3294630.1 hypothetical protein [Candidatus Fermentibacteria bacterium]